MCNLKNARRSAQIWGRCILGTTFSAQNKIVQKSEKELKDLSAAIASIILNQLDSYIAEKKETVRQNPESGAGSLFALPTDEKSLNKTTKIVESICNLLNIE